MILIQNKMIHLCQYLFQMIQIVSFLGRKFHFATFGIILRRFEEALFYIKFL
jgi:hypothetical protein